MDLETRSEVHLNTLRDSKPVGQYSEDNIQHIAHCVVRRTAFFICISKPAGGCYKVTEAISDVSNRLHYRSQYISHKVMSELKLTTGG